MDETIDHSTVGWAFKRLRMNYLELLILLLHRELQRIVRCELYMVDSTGISTPHLRRRRRAFKTVMRRETMKLHALIGYAPEKSALMVCAASVTGESVHDSTQFKRLLSSLMGEGEPLLADSAYDAESNMEFARRRGFMPVIKLRSYEPYGFIRREAAVEFERSHELYRRRGIAEAFFAGLANRYGSRTRCKLLSTEIASILLMAVAHNLRTYARIRAQNSKEINYCLDLFDKPHGREIVLCDLSEEMVDAWKRELTNDRAAGPNP